MTSDALVQYFADTFMNSKHSTQHVEGKSALEALVVLIAIMLGFITTTGLFRKNHRFGKPFNMLMLGAYVSLPNLISNALGRLNSVGEKADDQVTYLTIWATILLIGHACADSMDAVELNNNEEYKKYILQFLIFVSLLTWLFINEYYHFTFCLIFLISTLWANIFLKVEERARAFWYASKPGVQSVTRVLADYMMYEHKLSDPNEVDPTTFKGYKYLVELKDVHYKRETPYYLTKVDTSSAVTLEKIWGYEDQGKLLTSKGDPKGKFKDLCLSMSLFWLLLRRFGGYYPYESALASEKTWRFVQQGLLSNEGGNRSERVFRVIEVELKFLHDFLYTKYYASFYGAWQFRKKFCQLAIMITFSTFYIWLTHFLYEPTENNIITWVVLTIFTSIEIAQVAFLFFSEWSKVRWICWYVNKDLSKHRIGRWFGELIRLLCQTTFIRKQWSRKLGQYSLIDSYNYNPWMLSLARKFLGNLVNIPRVGQTQSPSINFSPEIQEAVITCFRQYDRDLDHTDNNNNNDDYISSWRSKADWISDNCKLETQTHVILVWHIATSYCEMSYGGRQQVPAHLMDYRVAKQLSCYCAYLAAIAPKLLPDSEQISISVFDEVIKEANEAFKVKSCMWCFMLRIIGRRCRCNYKDMFHKIKKLVRDDDDSHDVSNATNIKRGVSLIRR